MHRSAVLAVVICGFSTALVEAQPARLRQAMEGNTRERRPNDNVEGTIYEYKGELTKGDAEGKRAGDKDAPTLEGMFRLEGEAIFAVGVTIDTPGKADRKRLLENLRSGKSTTLRSSTGKPKRIGEYRVSDSGRIILNFDDTSEGGLNGTLSLRKDKDQRTVYFGDFKEKEGDRTVRTWRMTVRKVQD